MMVYHNSNDTNIYSKDNACRTQCTRLPLYAGSGRGECRLALLPFYGEAAPKSRTRDLPLMGEGTCHRTKCDLSKDNACILYN
ncbi:hypothetical protein DVH24_020265 [Malus domestica]|uniref:Uncharacterized protein n=1 Tax=Malus domestica TaxID=3750 RepID=A0A498JBT6_MALDO|nr:hypothetical protein DVH24_020265 [Malus domestica]